MKKLKSSVAFEINQKMIENYSAGEMIGIKEVGLLESAMERPFQTMFGDELYPSVFDKATALFESLAKNHVFFNGNKRTALGCAVYFLYLNGYVFLIDSHEAANLVVDFVTKEKTFEDVSNLFKGNSIPIKP